jgi:hypothetical protein
LLSAKLKSVGIRTTHRLSADVFNTIQKLGVAVKKKKKGKGKKGKKVSEKYPVEAFHIARK